MMLVNLSYLFGHNSCFNTQEDILLKTSFLLLTLLSSIQVFSMNKVIYGSDNRKDLVDIRSEVLRDISRSTAAQVDAYHLQEENDGMITLSGRTLATKGICEKARFSQQMTIARCSGFLVGEDLLVTAGHCMKNSGDCSARKWIFDYAIANHSAVDEMQIPKENVYNCKEIISQVLDNQTGNDFALIRLGRKVADRPPLSFRKSGKIKRRTKLIVMGHPSGLPLKIADGAKVRKNSKKMYFVANLDTFGGNSGSAVFNAKTHEVEGILVRGETDYEEDSRLGCLMPKKCRSGGCRGEDVTRITNIQKLLKLTH